MNHQTLFDAITEIALGACAYPDEFRSYIEERHGKAVLVMQPHMADYPKLIGKGGRQVKAFKCLVEQAGVKNRLPISLAMEESFVGHSEPADPWAYKDKFDSNKLRGLLEIVCSFLIDGSFSVVIGEQQEVITVRISGLNNETLTSALDAVLYPYVYAKGRKLKLFR